MSHFTVAIITKGNPTYKMIEEALAPYQENNMGDCPRKYMEFHSLSKEYKEEYETGGYERVKLKDGTLVYPWDDSVMREVTKEEYEATEGYKTCTNGKYCVRDLESIGAELVEIPYKEIYPTFEEYLTDWHGAKYDEETLDYGYWENPNAKWDWWQIGGRWAGNLYVAKNCENCAIGEKAWDYGNVDPYKNEYSEYKCVDSARIKDLVFPNYQKKYNKAKRFWELYIEGQEPITAEDKELIKWVFFKKEYFINTYKDKETYAECEAAFNTYAVIDKDGEWHAKGEMGWFGCSSEEEDQVVNFIKGYKAKVFDNASEDDYITIVDCHI